MRTESSSLREARRSPAAWLAILASAAILMLGVRAFFDPVKASAAFGLPMQTALETTFVRIYGSRNTFLGALGILMAALGMWRALALMFTAACVLPLFDASVIIAGNGVSSDLLRHFATLIVLIVASVMLWRFAATAPRLHVEHT